MKRASLLLLFMLFAANCFGANALEELNKRRARAGLPAFKPDAQLQAAAERSASAQARRGARYPCLHIGADPAGKQFNTCYAFGYQGGYAAAAAVVGPNGSTYYALDIRDTPSPVVVRKVESK